MEHVSQERRPHLQAASQHSAQQRVTRQAFGAVGQQQHGKVTERGHQPQQTGIRNLVGVYGADPAGRCRGRPDRAGARGFDVVQSHVVITIGSWMASIGSPYAAMYAATKAADEQLTRGWAAELGPRGVRVNAVAAGVTLTPGNEKDRPIVDAITAGSRAGVPVQPLDIAYGVAFLAFDQARMSHATTLYIDGGISGTRLR